MKARYGFSFVLWAALAIGCSKKSSTGGGGTVPPPAPPATVTPLTPLPAGWKYSSNLSTGFPTGLQAFTYDSIYAGRATRAFCVLWDTRSTLIDFKPVQSATAKTPSAFFSQEPGIVYVCINGGFYGGNQSFSLVKYNNAVSSANIKVVNRTFNGVSTPYYPTRGAFGITSAGTPSVAWIYSVGSGNDNIYSYPAPSPNAEGSAPQPVPTESFPAGGAAWNVVSAIGGSPVLIKDNTINITDVAELISINNTTSRPRSAIGCTAGGIAVILAVEGDNSAGGYTGMNLAELAQWMKNMGCTQALNLDGGGSTSMILRGSLTVRPGDNGVERPVVSAILLKAR